MSTASKFEAVNRRRLLLARVRSESDCGVLIRAWNLLFEPIDVLELSKIGYALALGILLELFVNQRNVSLQPCWLTKYNISALLKSLVSYRFSR